MNETRQSQVIVITSGKGGVGKTTSSSCIATGLAKEGYRTVVVDFDIGLRNLDLHMGCERRVVYDFINVVNGDVKLHQALIKDKRVSNLSILPASQTRDKDALSKEGVNNVLSQLREKFDFIICDSPAGIEKGAFLAMYHADQAIVVTNPEISSVRDSDRILGLLSTKTQKAEIGEQVKEHLLITRYNADRAEIGEMLSVKDIAAILSIPLIGVIPESEAVLTASNIGNPVINFPQTDAGQAYSDVIERLLGKKTKLRFVSPKQQIWEKFLNVFKRDKSQQEEIL
ncbi:MAG: septum site-determining protein MinD [Legionellales bacterium]|nr:septum site-determining protein MinD [Legionellales bacterium]